MTWPNLNFLLVCWVVTTTAGAGVVGAGWLGCAMGAPHLMQATALSLIWALHSLQLMRAMVNSD